MACNHGLLKMQSPTPEFDLVARVGSESLFLFFFLFKKSFFYILIQQIFIKHGLWNQSLGIIQTSAT